VNKDPFPHTATADRTFDSKSIAAGHSWSYVASKSGEFAYVCALHPGVKATLIVQWPGFPGREWATVGELAERLQARNTTASYR